MYVAADHVPSKASDAFGKMSQVVQLGPAQGEVGRYIGFAPVTLSPKVSSMVLLTRAARVVDETRKRMRKSRTARLTDMSRGSWHNLGGPLI